MIVFDLDHTLLSVNSSFRFGLFLYRQNFFSFWTLLACLSDYARHKWLGMPLKTLHANSFYRLFVGRSRSQVLAYVNQFLNENLSLLLFAPVVNRLKEAQVQGRRILILSSSPDFLVEEIARRLTVEKWKATVYQIDSQGNFSTLYGVMDGDDKALYVNTLARSLSIPLSGITAYSDSSLDLPLLKIVGRAIGVVPDSNLRRHCLRMGWEIIEEIE